MATKGTRRGKPEPPPRPPVGLYVVGGLVWGMSIALVLSLWVTIIYLIGGSEPFRENGTTYGKTVLIYVAAGVLVGALFGLARPWIRGHWSAAAFGFVGGMRPVLDDLAGDGELRPGGGPCLRRDLGSVRGLALLEHVRVNGDWLRLRSGRQPHAQTAGYTGTSLCGADAETVRQDEWIRGWATDGRGCAAGDCS